MRFPLGYVPFRDEIILTESIIDAVSLLQLGLQNVQAIYGTNGFTEEHLEILQADRVKRIVLALDNDGAGKQAANRLTARLTAAGFRVKCILPESKDWNQDLAEGITRETIRTKLDAAQWQQPAEPPVNFTVEKEGSTYRFKTDLVVYRVTRQKEIFVMSLKVTIKVESDQDPFYDTLDLYQSRARNSFAGKLAQHLDREPRRIDKDLVGILEYMEEERDRQLAGENNRDDRPVMSEAEKQLGLQLLEDPELFELIDRHMTTLGYVSERTNKLLVYLAAVSRVFKHPLNVYIQSSSSGGKTALLDTLEQLLPPEDVWKTNTISDQALHYVDDSYYLGKVFIMGEAVHDEKIEAIIRQMQSDGQIARLVTRKDERTEQMRAEVITKRVQMSFMITSTALQLNPENASRCLILAVDESAEQTKRIHNRIGYQHSYAGKLLDKPLQEEIIRTHRAALRLLEPVCVCNPFCQHIRFPVTRLSMRRAYNQFLVLIDAVCYLRQKQKQIIMREAGCTGAKVASIDCDLEDYRLAYQLFTEGVLSRCWEEIPRGTRRLYTAIRDMVRAQAAGADIGATDVIFIQKQVRDHTGCSREFIKKHIKLLVDYEYLKISSGRNQGTRHSYRLREDLPIGRLDIGVITSPAELEQLVAAEDK